MEHPMTDAEAVDMSRATAEYPEFPVTFGHEPMQLREFNATGVFEADLEIIEAFRLRHAI
jgi:creatinine amidohydrolase